MRRVPEPRTPGERLLADYFQVVRGWLPGIEWEYEPPFEGRRRRPDFRLRLGGWKCMLEVKEFGPPEDGAEGRRRARHQRIAGKIHAARRQLREFHDDHLCAVVLVSGGSGETDVDDPAVTLGALLEDPTFRFHLGAGRAPRPTRDGPPVAAVVTLRAVPGGVGVTVLENPLAERRFPSHLFRGPWDACWCVGPDGLVREFAGAELRAAEAAAVPTAASAA